MTPPPPPNLLSLTAFPPNNPFGKKKKITSSLLDFDLRISYHVSPVISLMYCLLRCDVGAIDISVNTCYLKKLPLSSNHTRCPPTGAIRAWRQKSWQRERESTALSS